MAYQASLVEPWVTPNESDIPSEYTKTVGTIRHLWHPRLAKWTWYRCHIKSVTWHLRYQDYKRRRRKTVMCMLLNKGKVVLLTSNGLPTEYVSLNKGNFNENVIDLQKKLVSIWSVTITPTKMLSDRTTTYHMIALIIIEYKTPGRTYIKQWPILSVKFFFAMIQYKPQPPQLCGGDGIGYGFWGSRSGSLPPG